MAMIDYGSSRARKHIVSTFGTEMGSPWIFWNDDLSAKHLPKDDYKASKKQY